MPILRAAASRECDSTRHIRRLKLQERLTFSTIITMLIFTILAIAVVVAAWWQHIRNRRRYK